MGANKPAAPAYGGLIPRSPGAFKADIGFQNELEVVRITKGKLARNPGKISEGGVIEDATVSYKLSNGQGGSLKVDVFGPDGELILVGGPFKQALENKAGGTTQRLKQLKLASEARGVKGLAYFTSDTPSGIVDKARNILGDENVQLFDRPVYKKQ